MKTYLQKNVWDAANDRMSFLFDEFDRVCVAFSGGKDSGVLLNLAIDHARRRGRSIGAMLVDLEGQYRLTMEYVRRMFDDNADVLDAYWVCLPINLRNAVSVYQPFWCCWDPNAVDSWIRPMPDHPAVISDPETMPFYRFRMEFEEFSLDFGQWYAKGDRTAILVGIRSDESLNRFRTIRSETKSRYKNQVWTTRVNGSNVYNAYPIYDWRTEDIWTANANQGWDYNRLYDMFYRAGVGLHEMRICQPYGDDQRIGLDLFRVIEPETWARVVNRVSGANFGNIYCGTKLLGYRKVQLPKGHTWRSYTKLLLQSLPPETKANYVERFCKFIRYWNRKGAAVHDDMLGLLPPEAEILEEKTNRGKKDKRLVRYKAIPDALDSDLESNKAAPTWRRMAACILKNDHLCKSLSFTQTKNQVERMKLLIEKYKSL